MQRKPVVLDTSGSIIVGYQPVNTDEDYIEYEMHKIKSYTH